MPIPVGLPLFAFSLILFCVVMVMEIVSVIVTIDFPFPSLPFLSNLMPDDGVDGEEAGDREAGAVVNHDPISISIICLPLS